LLICCFSYRQLYSSARAAALQELYKSKELDKTRPESIEADFEEVAASCGYFSFNLQDFASEMQNYLSILEELKEEAERTKSRSWNWLYFWRSPKFQKSRHVEDPEQEHLISRHKPGDSIDVSKDLPEVTLGKRDYRRSAEQNSNEKGGWAALYQKTLDVIRVIRRDDGKFAPFLVPDLSKKIFFQILNDLLTS